MLTITKGHAAEMNLNHLRVFHAVATAPSLTAASRALQISQPAVSKQLADFEEALGLRLVDRLRRGIRLTSAGKALAEHATRIFGIEHVAESELAAMVGLERGELEIGASTTVGSYLVPHVFGELHREHPAVQLELTIGNTAQVHELVRRQEIELGLTEGLVAEPDLQTRVFGQDDMVAITSPGDPLLERRRLRAADLAGFPFITRERGSGTREVIEAAFRDKRLAVQPVMALGSTEAVKNAVAAGHGFAIVSRLTVDRELESGALVALEIEDLEVRRELHLVELRGVTRSPVAARFVELLDARPGGKRASRSR
jgi:DNA-binding transcriptional LysR family regulator